MSSIPRIPEHQIKGMYEKAVKSPCADQYAASLKCTLVCDCWPMRCTTSCPTGLDDNNYEKDACQPIFDLYKDCKKLELAQRAERRQAQ